MQHLNVIVVVIVLIITVSAQNKYIDTIELNRMTKIEPPQIVLNLKSDKKLYCFFPLVKDILVFNVKTDKDIYVCLTPSYSLVNPRYYEINIGGWDNSKSTFAKDGPENYLAVHQGAIIERGKFNKFWIRINKYQGAIEVGRGETNSIPFMRVVDTDFVEMQYFGMSSFNNAAGEWVMDRDLLVPWD